MILCKNGHENPDGATFCAVCHAHIDAAARPVASDPSEAAPPQPETPPSSRPLEAARPVVSLSQSSVRVLPGGEATCEIRLQNPGPVADDYTIELVGEAEAWALIDPWLLTVAPGASATSWATFTPERSRSSGPVPFHVKVTSRQLIDEPVLVLGVVEVAQPAAVVSPGPAPAPAPASASPGRAAVRGVVRGMEQRVEWGSAQQSPVTIFTFRVECRDDEANVVALVPVEMRAPSFRGGLSDGDSVEIDTSWKPGVTVEARRVRNLTTNAWFEVKRRRLGVPGCAVVPLALLLVCAVAARLV